MPQIASTSILLVLGCVGDPDPFEEEETRKLLGVPVLPFPGPQGVLGFDGPPSDAAEFPGEVHERKLAGPEPRPFYTGIVRKRVRAIGPDGKEFIAYCGRAEKDPADHEKHRDESGKSLEIAPGKRFPSTLRNRRHRYGRSYHPSDIYIGTLSGEILDPVLFFRDVGSHDGRPHYMAIDRRGRCHLAVCDVLVPEGNRFKLYWLVGDPSTGKWENLWLVHHRREFTSVASPIFRSLGDSIHLVWNWEGGIKDGERDPLTGIYHLEWTPAGFGRKVRVAKGSRLWWGLHAEIDAETGIIIIAFNDDGNTFVTCRRNKGAWTKPRLLCKQTIGLSLERAGPGSFVVRSRFYDTETRSRGLKEFLVTFSPSEGRGEDRHSKPTGVSGGTRD